MQIARVKNCFYNFFTYLDAKTMRLLLLLFVLAIGCSTISHYDAFHKEQRESRFEVGFL